MNSFERKALKKRSKTLCTELERELALIPPPEAPPLPSDDFDALHASIVDLFEQVDKLDELIFPSGYGIEPRLIEDIAPLMRRRERLRQVSYESKLLDLQIISRLYETRSLRYSVSPNEGLNNALLWLTVGLIVAFLVTFIGTAPFQ